MKKNILTALAILFSIISYAQNFNYQAVVRDATGTPATNQSMTVLVRIIAGGPSGSVLYNEVHTVTSNAQGVITFPVGGGTSGANFQAIDWSTQNHWIDIQVDLTGGSNYTQVGTSKLQFVPYAMYALNSAEAGNAGIFAKNGTVISNGNGDNVNDDFIFGSSQLDYFSINSPLNARMFYDKSKRAFRAGFTFDDEWDEANVGDYSVGFGEGGIASGRNSFSMGRNANATGLEAVAFGTNAGGFGNYSRGFGVNARAFGVNATAIGRQLTANSMAEIQLGQYSKFVSGSADTWVPTDRLFVIGNGQEDINQALNSDALVMLKNGNTTLNGTLTIDGDNQGVETGYTLPAQDGTANQVMTTDGSGNISWADAASGSAGAFSTTANVTSNANGTVATDDFVFGSTQLDGTGNSDNYTRMFFDKSKGAFRAGEVEADEWDDANVGTNSVSLGINNISSGAASFTAGDENQATRFATVALGLANRATGSGSVAIGSNSKAESRGQISLGVNNTTVAGDAFTHIATDRLFVIGNGITATASDALVMLKNGNTTLNGTLTIDGDNAGSGASYTLPAQDGTTNQVMTTDGSGNVAWANAAAGGAFSTTANVTSNANGALATDDFVFGSTQLDNDTNTTDDDNRMFFNKGKAAFRVGHAENSDWNDENVGNNSMALGYRSIANGNTSIALGRFANAISDESISIGHAASGSALRNISIGYRTYSASKEQITIGSYNTLVIGDENNWVSTDRLFVIGNGDADNGTAPRSDALVMLKNGNTTLNGSLTIDGDNAGTGRSYTLPEQDGAANQIMSTDGSGNVSWITSPVDGDSDSTNEIELPVGGSNGQVLQTDGSGGYTWTDNTVAPGTFNAATMASGWAYYNASFSVTNFQDPRYRKVNNVVTLEGLCNKSSAIINGEIILTLPIGYRPLKTRIFTVETENGSARVDVNPNGTVIIATGFNVNQNWVSLDGLTFSID